METRLLEHFVTVADEGNVTRAAERLWAAQSTVSAGIASLERALGVQLFDRIGRRLVITETGSALLPHARQALAAVQRLQDEATSDDAALRGRVRLGIFTSMDIVDLTAVLRRFRARHPLVAVELMTSPAGTTGLVQDLVAGRLDLAYSGLQAVPDGVHVEPLRELPFRVFVSADHPLAERAERAEERAADLTEHAADLTERADRLDGDAAVGTVTLAELVDEPFIDTAAGFGNRLILDEAFARRGLRRHVVAEMNDMPAVIRFAAAGLGVGIVPDAGGPHEGVVLELADTVPPLRIGLAMRTAPEPNRATSTLARDIVAAAR